MNNKSTYKKISTLFITTAMIVTMLPKITTPILAQTITNELPDKTQFATKEELTTFNTNNADGINPAKVYFGINNQQWWIAGYDTKSPNKENVVLFAASPLEKNQKFEQDVSQNKAYSADWNCDYTSTAGSNPSEVSPNHYGASPLRTTLKGLETSYFTTPEQNLMNPTTIYTIDAKNNSVYSTTDKLYLAYGDYNGNQYITVGTNSQNSLNNGLPIDMYYWGNSGNFWLRAPIVIVSDLALIVQPGSYVRDGRVNYDNALVPAFELNLSSVLLASALPAASTGNLTLQDVTTDGAFTLRFDASKYDKNLGSAVVSFDKSTIRLSNVPNDTYLVIQNKASAKTVMATGRAEVKASDSDIGLDSFEKCKVWLETTDATNRITYATLATQGEGVAKIGDKQYGSLQEAFNAANVNDTVVLLNDTQIENRLTIEKNINLDLNGKTLNIGNCDILNYAQLKIINRENKGDIKGKIGSIYNNGELTVEGSISCNIQNEKIGKIISGTYLGNNVNYGQINGGNFFGQISNNGIINNGTFSNYVSNLHGATINGGNFDINSTVFIDFGILNGGNFAKEPIIDDINYGEGKVLALTNNTDLPYEVMNETDTFTLKITLGNNLILESGKLEQKLKIDDPKVEIQPIIINVDEGFNLEEKSIKELQAKGLSVAKEGNKITVSGALTESLTINLNAVEKSSAVVALENNKPVTTPSFDDGGPFTTNAEGDVFDRWGNLIYDAPVMEYKGNSSYSFVNTFDK